MNIAAKRSFFFIAAATAVLSLTGGTFAKGPQGSGIVGSVIVQGHKTTCKPVIETQCTVDSHGHIGNCHEVSTTQCTIADVSHGGAGPSFGSPATAPLSLSRAPLPGATSGPAVPAAHFAAPPVRASVLRSR